LAVQVDLVVTGRGNAEVAALLHIAPATVKADLSHIYAKVGVANRTELATVAASAPLTDNIRST
jgi:DNA-binding CsgD family transcriptional regulator